jgi:hydrogenase maturation factor
MNLLYGEIVEMFPEDGMLAGKIRIGGVLKKFALDLLVEPQAGDQVLICDGVAIARVERPKTD